MKNNTSKYIKYAIGEIILVVIGILIALQINNWNESRKYKLLKVNYLQRLSNDIKQDTVNINETVELINNTQIYISDFISALEHETMNGVFDNASVNYFEYGWIIAEFSPVSNTYTDLSQTGNMKIIDNSTLADKIIEYYGYIDVVEKSNKVNKDWITSIDIEVAKTTDAFQLDPITQNLFQHKIRTNALDNLIDNVELLERNAAGHFWINTSLSNNLIALKGASKRLLQSIEEELILIN